MDLRGDLGVPPLSLLSVVDDDLYLCLTNRHPHSRSDNNLLVSQVASVDHGRAVASDKVGSINHKKELVVVSVCRSLGFESRLHHHILRSELLSSVYRRFYLALLFGMLACSVASL